MTLTKLLRYKHNEDHSDLTLFVATVEGYCRGLPAGAVMVGWNVGDCVNQNEGFDVGRSFAGWKQTVRIIVEELDVENAAVVIV